MATLVDVVEGRKLRDHPPMLADYVSTTTGAIVLTACECCGATVAEDRAATSAEQDAHAIACKAHGCRANHKGGE